LETPGSGIPGGGGGLIAPFPGAGKMIINDVLIQLGDPRFNFCKLNRPASHLKQVRLWFSWIVIYNRDAEETSSRYNEENCIILYCTSVHIK
jgi:hypothetical protein